MADRRTNATVTTVDLASILRDVQQGKAYQKRKPIAAKRVTSDKPLTLSQLVAAANKPARTSDGKAAWEGAKSGALLGGGDEIEGAGGAVGNWLGRNGGDWMAPGISFLTGRGYDPKATFKRGSGSLAVDFEEARKGAVDERDRAWETNKGAYAAGYAPGLITSFALPAGRLAAVERPAARYGAMAAAGAGYGGLEGGLSAEPGERLEGATKGAAIGAVAAPVLGRLVDNLVDDVPKLFQRGEGPEVPPTDPDADLNRIAEGNVVEEPFRYNPVAEFGEPHPADLDSRMVQPDTFNQGLSERDVARYQRERWQEKQAASDEGGEPVFADNSTPGAAENPIEVDVVGGTPDQLTFPNGNVADINTFTTDDIVRMADKRFGGGSGNADPVAPNPAPGTRLPVETQARGGDLPVAANDPGLPMEREAALFDDVAVAQQQRVPFTGDINDNSVTPPIAAAAPPPGPVEPPIGGGAGVPPSDVPPPSPPGGGDVPPPADSGDLVARLTSALTDAGRLNQEQRQLYTKARSEKLTGVRSARATTGGEEGLFSELGQLKGELPKVDFEPVRGNFTQEEVDTLFDTVKNNPDISLFGSINARVGLTKLLDGAVPTKSELTLLGKVFPPDFIKAALKNRTLSSKLLDAAGNALNLPRSLMSSFDLSAPFRQGISLVGRKEFWNGFASMFKQFGSQRAFDAAQADIVRRETYPLMEKAGLALTEMGHDLTNREEAFMSQWAEKIPIIGRGVKASDRGFTGFLNKVRADTFDNIVELSRDAGIDFDANPKALTDIASFVNNATGRGSLGKLAQAGPLLNGLFFSPRLIASRVNLLNPVYYASLSPVVRKEAIKSLVSVGALASTVATLASLGGADVETDPRSSDFAKIKTGNTRYDILGGFGGYIVLGARLARNERKTAKGEIQTMGEKFGSPTRLDTGLQFLINKESPIASYVTDFLRGKTVVGEPFYADEQAIQRFIPLFMQDLKEAYDEEGMVGVAKTAPAVIGFGVQTYDAFEPRVTDTINIPNGPKGVKLDREAYRDYKAAAKAYVADSLREVSALPGWKEMSEDDRRKAIQTLTNDGRKAAREALFGDLGTPPEETKGEEGTAFEFGVPTSGMRTEEGNRLVGGQANSRHLDGDAVDFVPSPGVSWKELVKEAKTFFGPDAVVIHEYPGTKREHVHVQMPGMGLGLFGQTGTVN